MLETATNILIVTPKSLWQRIEGKTAIKRKKKKKKKHI